MIDISPGERILDIGCGTGVLVPYIKKAIGDAGCITAVDFLANMIAKAKEKHRGMKGVNFLVTDIMDFHHDETFNKIICLNFFPHVSDKQAFLLKLRGMLAEDGCHHA